MLGKAKNLFGWGVGEPLGCSTSNVRICAPVLRLHNLIEQLEVESGTSDARMGSLGCGLSTSELARGSPNL